MTMTKADEVVVEHIDATLSEYDRVQQEAARAAEIAFLVAESKAESLPRPAKEYRDGAWVPLEVALAKGH